MKFKEYADTVEENYEYERQVADKLHKSGRGTPVDMVAKTSRSLPDTHIIDDDKKLHRLEIKKSHHARFGSIAVHHTPEKGYHISDAARKKFPAYADHVEKSGILDVMNIEWKPPHKKSENKDIYKEDKNGAEGVEKFYGHDKAIPYIHIGNGHGFFKTTDKDPAKLNAPKFHGGIFHLRARFKDNGRVNKDKTKYHSIAIESQVTKNQLGVSHLSLDADPN